MTPNSNSISHKLCPYVQRAVIALNEKGVPFERIDIDLANKPDWFLKISPLGKVPVLLVDDRRRRGGAVREQRDLRIHRGHARRRKTASAGSAAAGAAPRLDGVRLDDPQRIVGPRDHWRCRDLRDQTLGGRREICARRGGAGLRSILCRRTFQPGGRGVRADLSLFRRVRSIDRSLRSSRKRRRYARGGRSWQNGQAFALRSGPTIPNCCMRSWFATTRIC